VEELLRAVESDPATIGLILHGSRTIGAERPSSDDDLVRVVTDDEYARPDPGLRVKDGTTDVVFQRQDG